MQARRRTKRRSKSTGSMKDETGQDGSREGGKSLCMLGPAGTGQGSQGGSWGAGDLRVGTCSSGGSSLVFGRSDGVVASIALSKSDVKSSNRQRI